MARCDKFVLLNHVQFEKNGYQNRFKHKDKWITKSVNSGVELISDKTYTDGTSLAALNGQWIRVIARTLGIKTLIYDDSLGHLHRSPDSTWRLVELVKQYRCDTYVTSPTAKDKYLDEGKFKISKIGLEYCECPKHLQVSIFEAFETWGIDGTARLLNESRKSRKVLQNT